jgi:hypothetical protein
MARERKPKGPGKRIEALVRRLAGGERIIKQLPKDAGDKVHFWFEPSSKPVPPKTFERALADGLVKPVNDGLFDEDTSQTWVLA